MNRTYFSKFQQCKEAHVKLFKKSAIHLLLHHESNTGLDKTTLIRIREVDVKNVPRNSPYVYISLYNDLTTEFSNIGYLSCNYSNSLFDFLSKRKTIQVPITYFSNAVQQSSRFGSGSDLGLGSGSGSGSGLISGSGPGSGPTTETLNGIILGKRTRSDDNVSLLDSDSETKNENSIKLKRVRHDEKSPHQHHQQQQQSPSPSQLPLQFQYYSNESVSIVVKNLMLPFTFVQINLLKQRLDWFITSLVRREYLNRLKLKPNGLQQQSSSQPVYNVNTNANASGENATDLAEKFHLWTSDRIQDDLWSFVVIALFINQQPVENPKILQHHLNLQQLWIQVEHSLLCLRINNKCILSHPHHFKLEHFEQHLTELGHQLSAIDTNLSSLKPLNNSSTYNIQKHLRQFISQWRPRYEWVGVDDDMEKKNPIAHWFPKFPSFVHVNGKAILPGSKLYTVLPFDDDYDCDAEEDGQQNETFSTGTGTGNTRNNNYGCIIQVRPMFITDIDDINTQILGTKQTTIPKIRIKLVHEDVETQIRHMDMVAYLRECTRKYPEGADIPYQMEPGSTKKEDWILNGSTMPHMEVCLHQECFTSPSLNLFT